MSTDYEVGEVGKPSAGGGYSAASVAIATVGGVVGAYVLSWIYGPLEHWVPWIYANAVLTYFMGVLVGKVGQTFLRRKCIDGREAAMVVGGVSGLFATWFSWLSYIFVVVDYDFSWYTNFLFHPFDLFDLMQYIAHNPIWTMGKSSSSEPAVLYYCVWFLELAIIVGVAMATCLRFVKENHLCGCCHEWIKETGDVAAFQLPADAPMEVINALSSGDASVLTGLSRRPEEGDEYPEWVEAKGYACPNCQEEDSYVTTMLVTLRLNKKSKELERVDKILGRYVKIDVETEKKIFEPAETPPAPADAVESPETSSDGD